jgi:hypothetical protein
MITYLGAWNIQGGNYVTKLDQSKTLFGAHKLSIVAMLEYKLNRCLTFKEANFNKPDWNVILNLDEESHGRIFILYNLVEASDELVRGDNRTRYNICVVTEYLMKNKEKHKWNRSKCAWHKNSAYLMPCFRFGCCMCTSKLCACFLSPLTHALSFYLRQPFVVFVSFFFSFSFQFFVALCLLCIL